MKNISSAMTSHLSGEVTTLATCWKITRRDGTVLGFTDHDQPLTYESVTYEAASGFTPSAVASSAALNVDDLDIEGMLSDDAIDAADIRAGKYDYAEIEVFQVNYANLAAGALIQRTGWLGEVETRGEHFIAEVRGLTQQLSQTIGERYSAACRANLGDARCRVTLASYTVTGSITSVESARSQFSDSANAEEEGYFTAGLITFTSGANNGLSMEVKSFAGGTFVTVLPLPGVVEVGDSYSAVAGCDKRVATCRDVFSNAENFRGEPHVPGLDKMLQTSGTRSDWGSV